MNGAAVTLISIAVIFAFATAVALAAELIERWANRRADRRRQERLALRHQARDEFEYATQYEPTFAVGRRVW